MTARILPFEEWNRLQTVGDFPSVLPYSGPADMNVLVIEDEDGSILGAWSRTIRLEGIWIHPDHRKKSGVFRQLIRGMRERLIADGVHWVTTGAVDDDVRMMLQASGAQRIEGESYVLPVAKEFRCRSQE